MPYFKQGGLLPFILLVTACSFSPSLPKQPTVDKSIWLSQNWTAEERHWYHHESQGTSTFPVPYEWFMALEQPEVPFTGKPSLLSDSKYLSQFGFIPSHKSQYNPGNLPVGFAITKDVINYKTGAKYNAIGLTCAACHTGHMTYQGISIRYDGGPAMTDLDKLSKAIGGSLLLTELSPERFERFAKRVLGDHYSPETKQALKTSFDEILGSMATVVRWQEEVPGTNVEEGFTRLDALNRIGNQVFAVDTGKAKNYAAITAPVNYPHIWNTPWFAWAQYDGSIRQPMVRNAGEALGVSAQVNLGQSTFERFDSSVPMDDLFWMEELLAGKRPPTKDQAFTGLQSPKWPEAIFGKIDPAKAAEGEKLYNRFCARCHLPAPNTKAFWNLEKYWEKSTQSDEYYLNLSLIAIEKKDINPPQVIGPAIGTDPGQAAVITERQVDTKNMQLTSDICLKTNEGYQIAKVTDAEAQSFALALGVVVEKTVNHWYQKNSIPPEKQRQMNGYRENCLQAVNAYKARPLNGIWATGPFLHNGSVPTLYDLLSPVSERPKSFYLGNLEFDPVKVGYRSELLKGSFELNTQIDGNRNTGHEYNNGNAPGVIGRYLQPEERMALIEYLKTL